MTSVVERIVEGLNDRGYHHEPAFGSPGDGGRAVLELARQLGVVFVASGLDPDRPILTTEPSPVAPSWRPFDRPEAIGWHNDFSTFPVRPVLSLSWIVRADPEAGRGQWRVASVSSVLDRLSADGDVGRVLARLRTDLFPFGYNDGPPPSLFPLVAPVPGLARLDGLRYYGRALREGAQRVHGSVPPLLEEVISRIQAAADAVGEELDASPQSLLVCHNDLSLHDRTAQTTDAMLPRQAILCFVSHLHQPLQPRGRRATTKGAKDDASGSRRQVS